MLSSFLGTYSGSNNIPPMNNNNNTNNNNNSLPTVHTQFKCDGCGISPIKGIKYHCCNCNDFDLCEDCYIQNKQQNHYNGTHSFTGIGNSKYNKQSTTTPPTTATTTSTTTNNNNMNTSRSTNPTPPPVMLNSNNNMNNNNKPAPFVYKFPTPPTNNYNYNNNYNNPYVYNHSLANSSSSSITTMNNNNLLTSSSSSMNNSYHSVQQQQPTFVGTYHPPTPTTLPFSKPLPTTPVTTSTTSFLQPKPIVTPPTSLSSSTTMINTNSNILTNNTTGSSTTALCKDHHHHSETCHCCNKEITENSPIYPCVTCIEKLNDEKNYVLCNDCYENYKELQKNNLEDVIHLKEHEFKEFLTLKQFSIWKKTLPSNANGGKKSGKDLQYHELNSLGIEEDTLLCVVCSEKLRNVVYLKCKHIVCCNDCVTQECPICRSKSEYITIIWS